MESHIIQVQNLLFDYRSEPGMNSLWNNYRKSVSISWSCRHLTQRYTAQTPWVFGQFHQVSPPNQDPSAGNGTKPAVCETSQDNESYVESKYVNILKSLVLRLVTARLGAPCAVLPGKASQSTSSSDAVNFGQGVLKAQVAFKNWLNHAEPAM